MPEMDGITLLKQIRARTRDLPFILFTGKGREEVVIEALNNGADFYLQKGGDPKAQFTELEHKIRQAIRQHESDKKILFFTRRDAILGRLTYHDIANRLTVLRGRLRILRNLANDPVILDEIQKVENAGRDIYSFLETARMYQEIGSQTPQWQNVENDIRREYARLESKQLILKTDISNLEIHADPLSSRVFLNLFDNTIRHGIRATEVMVSLRKSAQGITILWEDNGIGIPRENKEQIFFQGAGNTSSLGLSLCREILAITGITLAETGIPGTGARFEISIPEGAYRFAA
jgi:signal transduction histidine kinase